MITENTMKTIDPWKESHLIYFLSDLGMDLNQSISLPKVFLRCAEHFSSKVALMEKKQPGGKYEPLTYGEVATQARAFAAGLIAQKVEPKDRIAIFLKNSPAWVISDFGTMFAAGATVPIYETLIPEAIRHILKDSGAVGMVVEDKNQFEKIKTIWDDLPNLRFVILRKPEGVPPKKDKIFWWDDFLERGAEALAKDPNAVTIRTGMLKRDDVASIVYTSGTTGDPKGVMLSHRNFLSNVYGVTSVADVSSSDTMLSILPLSHVFERTIGYYVPILFGATIAYAESIDTVSANLQEIRPTICAAVPRLFEKIYARILQNLASASPVKKRLIQWAISVGQQAWQAHQKENEYSGGDRRLRHRPEDRYEEKSVEIKNPGLRVSFALADRLVYNKFRQSLGGRLRFFVSGGAPLNAEIIKFFRSVNIAIFEGYGLTESSPVISFNYGDKCKPGTVGKLLPYVQVKLSPEGEILVRGPNVMTGYFNNPKATADAIDAEGWLHTGDVGVFDEDNFLKITDRIKEIIVMSNGKNVAPLPIENRLTQSPLIANAMAIGNNRKFITALLFPALAELEALAKSLGISEKKLQNLCQNKQILEHFQNLVNETNKHLARYEQIKRFDVVPDELTVDGGEITPTLKLKRRILEKKYADRIARLYEGESLEDKR